MNDSSFIANGGNFTFLDKANVRPERLFFRLPFDRINWLTSSFLIGTLALTLTAVPLYLWFFGLDWFQVVLFFAMLAACGFSNLTFVDLVEVEYASEDEPFVESHVVSPFVPQW